jgi:nucleoside-diphosphate-sugar epimerase
MKTKLNFNNKNILVTGGSGFLGSKIVKAFLEFNANVYVLDLKLNKKFKAILIDHIITLEKKILKYIH